MSRAGVNHKIYLSATLLTSTSDSGTGWVEMPTIESNDNEMSRSEGSFKTRENGGAEQVLTGTFSFGEDLNYAYLAGDPAQALIASAIVNNTPLAIADVDGDITVGGTKGKLANMVFSNVKESKPIEGVVTGSATAKMADAFFNMEYTKA